MTDGKKRFQVALSFPGEKREYVRQVAELLGQSLGRDAVFYDEWHEAELARISLDNYLQKIYRCDSELVIPFLCKEYESKQWCGLEWRAIQEIIKERQGDGIMPLRFDDTRIPGLFGQDGYIDLSKRTPSQLAILIIERLQSHRFSPLSSPDRS